MSVIKLSGTIKLPKPHTNVKVQKLKLLPGGDPLEDSSWEVKAEDEGSNLVLNQGMQVYGGLLQSTLPSNTAYALEFFRVFNAIRASDDATAVSAATTAMAGTVLTPQSANLTVTDEGLIGAREYTKVRWESVFYKSAGLVNGYTFNKIYGICDNSVANRNPNLVDGSPISERLLAAPVTINDIETEAVKVTYDIFFPRFGTLANADYGKELAGSGSIVLQEKVLSDPATSGPTINWEMFWYGHLSNTANSPYNGTEFEKFSNLVTDTNTHVRIREDRTGDGICNALADTTLNTLTQTYPTSTSVKLEAQIKTQTVGAVDTSRSIYGLLFGFNNQANNPSSADAFSPLFIKFGSAITIDWRQTLEVHAEITFDWT